MINLKNLLDRIVATYQDVPDIVTAMDGEIAAIFAFLPDRPSNPNYDDMLAKMPWPSMMVSHSNTEFGYRGNITQWRHVIRVDIKLMGDIVNYGTMMKALVDGIPEHGDGLTITQCSFTDDVDSFEAPVFTRQVDTDGQNFYRFEFALQEKLNIV